MKLTNREGDFLTLEMTVGELETIASIVHTAQIALPHLDLVIHDLKPAGINLCLDKVEKVLDEAYAKK